MSYPDKEARAVCWAARDEYWACLDKHAPHHSCTSGEPEPQQCVALRKLYEKRCPSQWVKHFDRKRTFEQFKLKMAKGYEPLDGKTPK
ncbi:cytochrome c oxidase assembly factor 6 homolog [Aedes albopictus]|uniref:Cytochrome c oxidase assembly factor 6 n=1 Tax=Aedes albopictus TaxID=7160 RepID=A0A023ECA7_AEDAL|nr:cytochrome c oxidase assembly factor 6 homolog [Aedes albopictus]XP_029728613.1 cytochrome c oxidase assembly factor 6 homolog [Aedes albopictus]KXJ70950.1 hypothetical protein RP20_CCG021956 [Aedes albopictus]